MKSMLVWALMAGFFFVVFLVFTGVGIVRRKMWPVYLALASILLSGLAGLGLGYEVLSKGYGKVTALLKPRTGEEIYQALFGQPVNDCVRVSRYRDQIIPGIDGAIWLQVQTCPAEVRRITSQKNYTASRETTEDLDIVKPYKGEDWFKPELLGDSVIIFRHIYKSGDYQTIYTNPDSTMIYCADAAD